MKTAAPSPPGSNRPTTAVAGCLETRPVRPPEQTGRLQREILELKKKRNAVILAHNYQLPEIQDIADYVGDSLGLSYRAQKTPAEVILFCGVHFMAETAKIINPFKKVVIPDLNAGCSLADSCTAPQVAGYRKNHPNVYIVAYINCNAAVKALADIICTSGNAVKVVEQAPRDRPILFLPDENLGQWTMEKTGRTMDLWRGSCHVHLAFTSQIIRKLQDEHPGALLVAHPECTRSVRLLADHVCSTEGMVRFCRENPASAFLIATEGGMLHRLQKEVPGKTFVAVPVQGCACSNCEFMKLNTLEKVQQALETLNPEVTVEEKIRRRALVPIERMLAIPT